MKKYVLFVKSLVVATLLVSCHFSEELHITEDGSGKIDFKLEGSELLRMVGDKVTEGKEKEIDTLMVFKEFLEQKKDSIAQLPAKEQEKLKELENFKLHMVMHSHKQILKMDLYSEFKDVAELHDLFSDFKTATLIEGSQIGSSIGHENDPLTGIEHADPYIVSYSLKDNVFKRSTKIGDKEKVKKSIDSLHQMKIFLSSSRFKIEYHFPKKIKKISNKEASLSNNGKSLGLEVGLLDYMENPEILDLKVELVK